MKLIRYNENATENAKGGISLYGNSLTVNLEYDQLWDYTNINGMVTIQGITPYTSYAVILNVNGISKNFRQTYQSDFKLIELNRLGAAVKMDFGEIALLYSKEIVMQIDVGVWADDEKDIVVTVNHGKFDFLAAPDFDKDTFSNTNMAKELNVRTWLWDGYSITIDGNEQYRERHAILLKGENEPIFLRGREYIIVELQKYHGQAANTLNRNCDNEEVFIDCSCGVVDTKRVKLTNGKGRFKIFPFGYTGEVKLKLGRKFYDTWNDYTLTFVE